MKIHADLKPSRLRRVFEVALYLLVAVLCAFSALPLWVLLLTLLLLLVVFVVQARYSLMAPRLQQLVQLDRQIWCWYEVRVTAQHGLQSTRIDADLQQVQRAGPVIVLRFQAARPEGSRAQSWAVWRDQVDADTWRRLVVLARFWSAPMPQS